MTSGEAVWFQSVILDLDGKKAITLRGTTIAADFKEIVEDYIEKRYGA